MARRVPASMRSRQQLSDLIEGRLSSADGRAELIRLATRLIVEEALEAESADAVGREYSEHGGGGAYRNGDRTGRLRTAEGLIEYSPPQVTGGEAPFHSELRDHLKGRTAALEDLAVEMLARGLSVRDIEDAFTDESGRLLLPRTAVSEIGERLWADDRDFAGRDLSEYDAICRNTISCICSWTASPSGSVLGGGANRCRRPGASRQRGARCCCT